MKSDRRASQIHQCKWAHSYSERLAGNRINLSSTGHTFLQQSTGLIQPRHEETIHNKSRPILADDDNLSCGLTVLFDLCKSLSTGG